MFNSVFNWISEYFSGMTLEGNLGRHFLKLSLSLSLSLCLRCDKMQQKHSAEYLNKDRDYNIF